MMTKKPWASKTIWGAGMLLVSMILGQLFDVEIGMEEQEAVVDQIIYGIEAGTAVVGWLMVVYGRIVAEKAITLKG
jgi:hypothetical protein